MEDLCQDAFSLYARCISSGVVEYLQKQMGVKVRQSIYTAPVVIWLGPEGPEGDSLICLLRDFESRLAP